MSLNKRFHLFFSPFLIILFHSLLPSHLPAQTTPPKLVTKQSPANIVFLSYDGKTTYFQNSSGGLFVSSNYKIHKVMQSNNESLYNIYSSASKRKMILEVASNAFRQISSLQNNGLYLIDYGKTLLTKIAEGTLPQLHLNDSWMSFYNVESKTIIFKSLLKKEIDFQIKIKNPINSYFSPEVTMLDEENVIFTDLNNKGFSAIIHLQRNSQKISPVFKTEYAGVKIELCLSQNNLVIGQFALSDIPFGSEISLHNISSPIDFSKKKLLYRSMKNDIGNMKCSSDESKLFFIQDQSETKTLTNNRTEAVSLDLKTEELKTLSDLKYVTQVVNLDGRIMIPFRGDFYILQGETLLPEDTLKKKSANSQESPPPQLDFEE